MKNTGLGPTARPQTDSEEREALGADTPWPLPDVLDKLADAAVHLLGEHGCDAHGYELVQGCIGRAREYAAIARAAPDLLRENARLRDELARAQLHHNDFVDEMAVKGPAWRCEIAELRIELTRARAAHLENAELLAKANADAESMQRAAESSSRHYAEAVAAGGRVESVIRDALRALREVQESGDVDPEEVGGEINRVEHMLLGCLPAGETWPIPTAAGTTPADRKGNAAQPPVSSDSAADPRRVEGKKP